MNSAFRWMYWLILGMTAAGLVAGGMRYYLLTRGPVLAQPVPEPPTSNQRAPDPSANDEAATFRPVEKLAMVESTRSTTPEGSDGADSGEDRALENISAESIKRIERSKLPFELIGTTSGSPELEFAVLRHLGSKDVRQIRPGESWKSLKLTGVADEYVEILNKKRGKKELLELRRSDQSALEGSSKQGSGTRVSRYQINQAIHRNMNNLLAAVRAQPVLNGGALIGFRISQFRGKPGRLLKKLGFQEGDVIKRVNGHKIDSMQTALELWSQLKNRKHFRVKILRNSSEQTLEYTLVR